MNIYRDIARKKQNEIETVFKKKILPEPEILAAEAIGELEAVVGDLRDVLALIGNSGEENHAA